MHVNESPFVLKSNGHDAEKEVVQARTLIRRKYIFSDK